MSPKGNLPKGTTMGCNTTEPSWLHTQLASVSESTGPLSSQQLSAVSGDHRGRPIHAMKPATSSASPDACPSDEVVTSLVEQFFNSLYPLPSFNFLHKAIVVQRCRDTTIDKALKLAICAITALYVSKHVDEREAWIQESERLILNRLDRPSIFQLQASLLVIRYRVSIGHLSRAFMMAGLAGRWAVALRLNYEHSGLRPAAQEVRRRTFWSLYLLDDSFSSESKDYELFHPDIVHIQLPCEEIDFAEERLVKTGHLYSNKGVEPQAIGSQAAFVKLAFIRRSILRCVL